MNRRKMAVAGQFYPSDAEEIISLIADYNQILDAHFKEDDSVLKLKPRAVVVPHAGYVYSQP